VQYAKERKQFGVPIGSFGAIQSKIAEQAARTYASEAAVYRAGKNIEDAIDSLQAGGMSAEQAKLKGVEQFAIECAILKVHGSETLDFVVDEGVQIYGGMGYSADAPMERAYRDARINRIFEGTNEINRMLAVGTLLKKAMKGQLDLIGPAMAVQKEIMAIPDFGNEPTEPLAIAKKTIEQLKKAFLMVAGSAVQKIGIAFEKEQEVMMFLADMLIEIYVAESAWLRVEKTGATEHNMNLAGLYLSMAVDVCQQAGKHAINAFATGDEQRILLLGLKRFTKTQPVNTVAMRRAIAARLLA
jgi:hypothetical protein